MNSDKELREQLEFELDLEPRISPDHICIEVNSGVVMVHGYVCSRFQRELAAKIAKHFGGVHEVIDELEVRLPGSEAHTDVVVAAAS